MKRMIEYKPEITKEVTGILKMRTSDVGNGCLGWTHKSDTNVENATWTQKSLTMAQGEVADINACQNLHPSWIRMSTKSTAYTTEGDDLTDFSSANDWVFVYDPSSYSQRSGATETLHGKFMKQSGNTISFVDNIALNIYSHSDENNRIGQMIVDAGGKKIETNGGTMYIIPNQYIKYSSNKNAFTIDFTGMFGKYVKMYNEASSIQSDIRFVPTIDMRNNPIANLD